MRIEDGGGSSRAAKVNENQHLEVESTTRKAFAEISKADGLAYVISHGDFIALTTTGTETGILHFKNTSTTKAFYIESIRTCGTVAQQWKLYKNSTAGTLITDQTAGAANNLNLQSENTIEGTVYKGANAKTVSGGTMLAHHINAIGHGTEVFDGALILGTNDSIQLSVEVASAGDVCCRIIGFYE